MKKQKIPNELVIEELICKFREIPFEILEPAFRAVEMEVMDEDP